jgi:hypothetical protein
MRGTEYIKISLAALLLALSGAAQSGAYAKFDGRGEIIGLFNLSVKEGSCSDAQRLSGTVRNVKARLQESDVVVTFTLSSNDRRRAVGFSLNSDVVPREDIEKLLSVNGKERITVAACQNGSRWTAHEITRQ